MKFVNRFALVSLLTLCALLFVGSSSVSAHENKSSSSQPVGTFASGLSDGGLFIVARSAILGDNVSFVLRVDGQIAGTCVRFRGVETYLTPGRHVVEAMPNRLAGAWRGTVDIQAGKTTKYIAGYNVDHLFLSPMLQSWQTGP